jgi:hypothetical protein
VEFVQYPARLFLRKLEAKGPNYFSPCTKTLAASGGSVWPRIGDLPGGMDILFSVTAGGRGSYARTSPSGMRDQVVRDVCADSGTLSVGVFL